MDIYIIKKKLGSRKELGRYPVEIDETINTLGALLYILTLQGLTEAQTPKEPHFIRQWDSCTGRRRTHPLCWELWRKPRHNGKSDGTNKAGIRWWSLQSIYQWWRSNGMECPYHPLPRNRSLLSQTHNAHRSLFLRLNLERILWGEKSITFSKDHYFISLINQQIRIGWNVFTI